MRITKYSLLFILILFFISCVTKTVTKERINMENKTVELNTRIYNNWNRNTIYFESETVKFKDLDSVMKLRELQLDTIYSTYKSLK